MSGRQRALIFVLVVIAILVGAGVWFHFGPARGIRVGTAVVSKTLCTGVFVSGLDPDKLYAEAVKPIGGQDLLAKRLKIDVDRKAREVRATWAGMIESRAIYHEGFGCRLVHGDEAVDASSTNAAAGAMGNAVAASANPPLEIAAPSPELEAALDRAFAEPEKPPYRWVKGIVILRDGKLVAERYAQGYSAQTPTLGYSVSKSVTNALIGILVQQKKLSVEGPAPVAEWQSASDPRHAITIEQLMRMTSGLALEESDTGFDPVSRMLFLEPDMGGFAARAKLKAAPGTEWEYTSGNTLILSRIVRDAVGGHAEDVKEFAQRELFGPLGVTSATIEFDATGTPVGSIYVLMTGRDWARFGELYRNDGVVNGRRILPEGWVKYSTTPTLDTDYGAGFWTNRGGHRNAKLRIEAGMPEDAFYASGNLGQRVLVIPSEKLVIVRVGLTHSDGFDMRGLLQLVRDVKGQKIEKGK
jgi:CubicO group peptidase (beta-lactamase class C family)